MPKSLPDARGNDRLPAGVVFWDTFPPAAGGIRFLSGVGEVLATGRFRVVLGYGPGARYSMGWAIDEYRSARIPVVPRRSPADVPTVSPASREAAAERGRAEIGGGAAFLYWAGNVLLEVSEVRPASGGSPRPIAGRADRRPIVDRPLGSAEKASVLSQLEGLGLREDLRTALIFILEGVERELEFSRGAVRPEDVGLLVRAYCAMPSWSSRTGVAYLLQDQPADDVQPVWLDVLAAPDDGPGTVRHVAKAAALARLRGDVGLMEDYLDDHELLSLHAARWCDVVGRHAWGPPASTPGG